MLIKSSVGPLDEPLVEPIRADAGLVAANQQDGSAFGIECKRDPPHPTIGTKAQLFHVRMLGTAQSVDRGPTKNRSKMLQQPDPRNQLNTHVLRQNVRLLRKVWMKPYYGDRCNNP